MSYKKRVMQSYSHFTVTPISTGTVYEVTLNPGNLIIRSNSLMIMIVSSSFTAYPYRSIEHEDVIDRGWRHREGTADSNRFIIYKVRIRQQLLPAPYPTDCFNYRVWGFVTDAHCRHACMTAVSLANTGKLPFSVVINSSFAASHADQRMISARDISSNETIKKSWSRMNNKCSMCNRRSCRYALSLTVAKARPNSEFVIRFDVPSEPWSDAETVAAVTLLQTIIEIMGMIGTYTGIAMYSLSPAYIARKKKKWIRRLFCC